MSRGSKRHTHFDSLSEVRPWEDVVGKLVILGTEDDPHIPRVMNGFTELGGEFSVVDYRRGVDFTLTQSDDAYCWSVNGVPISRQDLIWNRMKLWYGSPLFFNDRIEGETVAEEFRRNMVRQQEWYAALHALKTLHADAIVNSPVGTARMSKPFQQWIASRLGFKTPRSLITTSKAELERFYSSCKSVIIKGQNGSTALPQGEFTPPQAIMTMRLLPDELTMIDDDSLRACPQLFQEEIEKDHELRIFATRTAVAAFRVDSQRFEATAVDWRFGNTFLPFVSIDIDDELTGKILHFLREFELTYGSFDFIVDRAGDLWFLECNPDGQWGFLETDEKPVVSQMLAREFYDRLQNRSDGIGWPDDATGRERKQAAN